MLQITLDNAILESEDGNLKLKRTQLKRLSSWEEFTLTEETSKFAQDTGKETQLEIKLRKSLKKSKHQLLRQE